jgi:hypothetical protein
MQIQNDVLKQLIRKMLSPNSNLRQSDDEFMSKYYAWLKNEGVVELAICYEPLKNLKNFNPKKKIQKAVI